MAKHSHNVSSEHADAAVRESEQEAQRQVEEAQRQEERERKRDADRDVLAKDEPFVLESSETDPEFPAMEEFEVDEGGAPGSTRKHPGLIWIIIAVVAVAVLVVAFILAGDWFTPDQAQQEAQRQFEEQVLPEDMGAN